MIFKELSPISLENIIVNLPQYVFWKNTDSIYLGCNENFARIAGLQSAKDIIGKTDNDLPWAKNFADIYLNEDSSIIETGQPIEQREIPILTAQNQTMIILVSKRLLFNEEGKTIGILGIFVDTTERKHNEMLLKEFNALKEMSHYYENIISHMPNNIYWLDNNCVLQGGNSNLAKMFGLNSIADLKGLTYEQMGKLAQWTEGQGELFKQAELEVMRTGSPRLNMEEPPVIVDGKKIYYISNKVPLYNRQNEVVGVLGISTDITDRKEYEKNLKEAKEHAEAADKAKTEFLMNMRHDIRTPLSGIIGFAGIIKDETKDTNIAEYADNMLASSQALLDFLNEILEAIKITSGDIPLIKKKFDLKEKLLAVITLNQTVAKQKNILLSFEYDERLPKYLLGDSKRVQRIVLELLSNALNFTHQGEVKVKAEFARQDGNYVFFKLIISDTGIGIPKNKLDEVFIRFTRLTPSYEGIYKGIGIGLTIIKQFIDDLDGEIYVDSELGKGSTFTCVFRFKEALLLDEQGVDHSVETMCIKNSTLAYVNLSTSQTDISENPDIRILVVEDSPIAAMVAEKLLTNLGCQVDVAVDGQSALAQTKLHIYDGIFMDVGLPDISGNEATRAFRAWESSVEGDRRTPIIALTAHVETEEKQMCIESGMDAVLSKPLTQEKAVDILAAFIPKYAANLESPKLHLVTPSDTINILPVITGKTIDSELAIKVVGTAELAQEMLKLLVDLIFEERNKIVNAYEAKNWLELQAIAHKLKGSSTYCGAVRLMQASSNLQNYLKTEKIELRQGLYQQLLEEIDLICKEFNAQ